MGFPGELQARFLGELPAGFLDELPVGFSIMSRDYVRGRGSRDVWTSDAALVGGGLETSGQATQILWGVGAETFAFDATLEGGGTETDCTSDAAYASCLFMLELNFHSGSSIYSSQWFACLASHTSRSNSPVTHPSFFPLQVNIVMSRDYVRGRGSRDVWTSDAALVGGGLETSGQATQILWGVGAETFAFDAALEGGGTETDCTSDAAYVYIYPYEEMRGHPIPHGVTHLLLTPHIPSPLSLTDCSGVYQFRKPCSEIVRMWMCDVVATTHFKPLLHEFLHGYFVNSWGSLLEWGAITCVVLYLSYTCYAWRPDWFRDSLEMELCFAISFLRWTCYHDIEYCWIA
ncbi:hypothetical protein F2Q69_00006148 [Brassica cretica]|uniref:Uncharacterized protein n=1 Tax=Brassica cretica TaxID=69181 RepID=A0A8S9PFS9_BRACR|nr:hypothetical protein F2Q69_00006148 [Brassica cretica]